MPAPKWGAEPMQQGRIFEIQHLALYDGPGVRTVIYLKGCPLKCAWCHNPEGQRMATELLFHAEKCVGCGLCTDVCPVGAHVVSCGIHRLDHSLCVGCGRCAPRCIHAALTIAGETVSVEASLQEILCDRAFFREEGGVTLSGGEPLMQSDFACALLAAAKEHGIHTCMETCGYAPEEAVRKAADVTDLFLYDIKELDTRRHKEMTGLGNEQILSNLMVLDSMEKRVILRCPVIPGQNMRKEYFMGVAALAQQLASVEAVEFEPYHPLGLSKYADLGRTPKFSNTKFLDAASLSGYAEEMRKLTEKPIRLSTGEDI